MTVIATTTRSSCISLSARSSPTTQIQNKNRIRSYFRPMKRYTSILACCFAFFAASAQKMPYHLAHTFKIASGGGWDYVAVDPESGNIYVSHATQVNVLSPQGDSVGVIPGTLGVHGIAFAQEYHKGYTSNGKLNNVTVFDLQSRAVQGQIPTGEKPDAIMYDPFSKKIYVCDGKSKELTVIDPATDKVVKTVALGGKPETAVSNEAGKLYINLEDKNEIVVLNTSTYEVESRWKTGRGEEPAGLAIDRKTKRLFAGCGNSLMIVMDAVNGKVIKELPIGDHCDGTAFDPTLQYAIASNGEGTITVVKEKSADDFEVLANVPTQKGARTIAINEKTHALYLPTADFEKPATDQPHGRPEMIPGTFRVLVYETGARK
jgi:YVTN family beta-propeller protein